MHYTSLIQNGIRALHCAGVVVLLTSLSAFAEEKLPPEPEDLAGAILTPASPDTPRINGARVFGVRPGSPVLYTVAATGARPMTFAAENLPSGLSLDPKTGQITGKLDSPDEYQVKLRVENSHGTAESIIKIVCGDTIALTPPMGWNSWNCFGRDISDEMIRSAADAIVETGLINHGWTYINIDDGWQGERDSNGNIQGNEKFPDMKALCDYVHQKGLKIGIYSSPGKKTCAGFIGSLGHEEQDAKQFAAWGFDYLKYDWCGYSSQITRAHTDTMKKPYEVMSAALNATTRDIVYSICQYGWADVSKWGAEVGGNAWRTTGDIVDVWSGEGRGSHWPVTAIVELQAGLAPYAKPGNWNDPDMMVVGRLGWGKLRPSRLTADEQYSHISYWSLLAAPLLIGCDLTQLDPFTLNLLTNDEVLAINQDRLGQQARRVFHRVHISEVWVKDLEDGGKAVGIFNAGNKTAVLGADWRDIGIKGKHRVRDLWRQKDVGVHADWFEAKIPKHGVMLLRLYPE